MVNDGYLYNMMEFVNGKDDIPYMMENKKCLKPPTRLCNDDIYLMSKIVFLISIWVISNKHQNISNNI